MRAWGVTVVLAGVALLALPPSTASAGGCRPLYDLIVAADGSGDVTSVQAAIDAVPAGNASRFAIGVRPGTYHDVVKVPSTKPFIALVGLGHRSGDVVIEFDNANGTLKPDGTPYGTTGSASVTIDGADFSARHLTFANTFDEAAHPEITNRQAVAVLTRADRVSFSDVRFLGNQDTLYLNSGSADVIARVYLHRCYVEGDVDFIFGRATAVLDLCEIRSLDRGSTTNNGYVTAPSTMVANPHGLLITHSRLTSAVANPGTVYLGRPWHPSNDPNAIGQTVIRDSWLDDHIQAAPWTDFGTWPWRDARFAEYHNRGPGAAVTADRPQLSAEQAATATVEAWLGDWHPAR